ncbi:hypothetical protein [Pedobacter sp. UC225_65]|uniref:hypothetical protein n=1 Tax=Pedobacter sp. UC225_65 TaxID=3350173 RepID=UPI00367136BB
MASQSTNATMNDLKLKFGTNADEIDANTLINSIIHFSTIVQEINKSLATGRELEVKIKAFEPGSFIVNLIIETSQALELNDIFTKDNISLVANIATTITGVFELAKWLKGKKPEEVNSKGDYITIKNAENNSFIITKNIYNIYKEPIVQTALAKEFETLNNDTEVKNFDIIDNINKTKIEFDADEISSISDLDYTTSETSRTLIKNKVSLNILSLSFDKKKKWEFLLDGNKITAKIKDDLFHEYIDKGESFAKGDTLIGSIEIVQHLHPQIDAYTNHSYTVTSIDEHIKRPKQGSLFEN